MVRILRDIFLFWNIRRPNALLRRGLRLGMKCKLRGFLERVAQGFAVACR